jgi:hypothetical protein
MREISRMSACFLLDGLSPRGLRLWILQPARGRLLEVNAVRHHWCPSGNADERSEKDAWRGCAFSCSRHVLLFPLSTFDIW